MQVLISGILFFLHARCVEYLIYEIFEDMTVFKILSLLFENLNNFLNYHLTNLKLINNKNIKIGKMSSLTRIKLNALKIL